MKPLTSRNRRDIYYWKCDRAAAFLWTEEVRDAEARKRVEGGERVGFVYADENRKGAKC